MIEVFSHDVSFSPDEETEEVFVIKGKGWENEPFKVYLRTEDVRNLMWQMNYYLNNREAE